MEILLCFNARYVLLTTLRFANAQMYTLVYGVQIVTVTNNIHHVLGRQEIKTGKTLSSSFQVAKQRVSTLLHLDVHLF